MNYFTPELYAALQDFSSDEAMNAADAAWEDAVDRYEAYYRSVAEHLPVDFRKLQEGYYLRDAIIREIARTNGQLLVIVKLEPPPHNLLLLRYELADEPDCYPGALPEAYRSKGSAAWLHDEVEWGGDPPRCIHAIQLSNGWEVRIPFRQIQLEEAAPIFPDRGEQAGNGAGSHSAARALAP